jgi:hypothetical protein
LAVDLGITDPIMEGITIPNIITTLAGTIIAPTNIRIIIVGIIGGTIGGIGIDRRRRSGATAPEGDAANGSLPSYFNQKGWDRQTIGRQRLPPANQFLQSAQTSKKPANRSGENRREHGLVRSG